MNIWYGDGPDDALSLGDPVHAWRAFGEVSQALDGEPGYEELESVPGFAEQEVTPWWLTQVKEQGERFLRERSGALSEPARELIADLVRQIAALPAGGGM